MIFEWINFEMMSQNIYNLNIILRMSLIIKCQPEESGIVINIKLFTIYLIQKSSICFPIFLK